MLAQRECSAGWLKDGLFRMSVSEKNREKGEE